MNFKTIFEDIAENYFLRELIIVFQFSVPISAQLKI